MKTRLIAALCVAAAALTASIGTAEAAQGCGPRGWRNYWGQCRYADPIVIQPSPVIYAPPPPPPPVSPYACPPGSWLGPWGHCRNTPYHGRLPNGGWQ